MDEHPRVAALVARRLPAGAAHRSALVLSVAAHALLLANWSGVAAPKPAAPIDNGRSRAVIAMQIRTPPAVQAPEPAVLAAAARAT
ncbi:MAG: hypothetical protein WA210_01905, partial [Burkholderiaceae bacterium]